MLFHHGCRLSTHVCMSNNTHERAHTHTHNVSEILENIVNVSYTNETNESFKVY
jgi:hypothetical protein